jgi:hypothetical protein
MRFSLRTFLIACLVLGVGLGLAFRGPWGPRFQSSQFYGVTRNGINYGASVMYKRDAFWNPNLLNVVVIPQSTAFKMYASSSWKAAPKGGGLEVMPGGVFFDGKLIGGYGTSKVLIVLWERDVRVIELSHADTEALETAAGPHMNESPVWREKVEPEIERLFNATLQKYDRTALGFGK